LVEVAKKVVKHCFGGIIVLRNKDK
jgi:hypothetical protein